MRFFVGCLFHNKIIQKLVLVNMRQGSQENQNGRQQTIASFYNEFGIKQYGSFSGGFRYHEKQKADQKVTQSCNPQITREYLYKELGVSKKNSFPEFYKAEKDYVPETKEQLADRLVDKLEHQMKKMRYYREKYYDGQTKP